MAEITASASQGQVPGVRKSKKLSTRVDLTPMVDLGFLLITFFIFTTNMSQPKSLRMIMPADGINTPAGESTALTVCPIDKDKVFYYHGSLENALQHHQYGFTGFSVKDGIGNIIREKQTALDQNGNKRQNMILIIKPAEASKFRNTVDLLDEVLINGITHYAFTDISEEEKQFINASGGQP